MTTPDCTPIRTRFTESERAWLVVKLWDIVWEADFLPDEDEEMEVLFKYGPRHLVWADKKRTDAAMALELLAKLNWDDGEKFAEYLLMVEVGKIDPDL